MNIPQRLLSRANKALMERVQQATDNLRSKQQALQQERLAVDETAAKLVEIRRETDALQRSAHASAESLQSEQQSLQTTNREVERMQQLIIHQQKNINEIAARTAATERQLSAAQHGLRSARERQGMREEDVLMRRIDNTAATRAAEAAKDILSTAERKVINEQTRRMEDIENAVYEATEALEEERLRTRHLQQERTQLLERGVSYVKEDVSELKRLLEGVEQQEEVLERRREAAAKASLLLKGDALRQQSTLALCRRVNNALGEEELQLEKGDRTHRQQATKKGTEMQNEEAELAFLEAECAALVTQLKQQRNERATLVTRRHQQQEAADHLTAMVSQQETRRGRLTDALRLLQDKKTSLAKLSSVEGEIHAQWQKELQRLETSFSQCTTKVHLAMEALRAETAEGDELQRKMAQTHCLLRDFDERLTAVEPQQKRAMEQIGEKDKIIEQMKAWMKELQHELSGANLLAKAQEQEEIRRLEQLKATVDKDWRNLTNATEELRRGLRNQKRLLAETSNEKDELTEKHKIYTINIQQLTTESEKLQQQKIARHMETEALRWGVQERTNQLNSHRSNVAAGLLEVSALNTGLLDNAWEHSAAMEALSVAMHAHEKERRKLFGKWQELDGARAAMAERYQRLMARMEQSVDPESAAKRRAMDAAENGDTKAAFGRPCSARGTIEDDGAEEMFPTAETLHAKHILHRASERAALQERGDALDAQLVASERDLASLDAAVALLRQPEGDAAPLVGTEGVVEGALDGDDATTRYARARVAQQRRTDLAQALAASEREHARLDGDVDAAREQLRAQRETLRRANAEHEALEARVKAEERKAKGGRAAVRVHERERENAARVVRVAGARAASYAAMAPAGATLFLPRAAAAADVEMRLYAEVVAAAASNPPRYHAYRALLDQHGLSLPDGAEWRKRRSGNAADGRKSASGPTKGDGGVCSVTHGRRTRALLRALGSTPSTLFGR